MIKILKPSKKIILSENKKMYASYFEKVCTLYNGDTYKVIARLVMPSLISQICFSKNSKMFAIKTLIGFIYVYRVDTFKKIATFKCSETQNMQPFEFTFSKDNKKIIDLVFTNYNLGYISIYDLKTKKEEIYFQGKNSVFERIEYIDEKQEYFITGYDKLNLKKENRYFYAFMDLDNEKIRKVNLKNQLKKITYSRVLNKTYSLGTGKDVNKIFKFNKRIYEIDGIVEDINVSNNGEMLLTVNDKIIVMWDTKKYNMLKKFEMENINYVNFNREDTKLFMCSDEETVIYEL